MIGGGGQLGSERPARWIAVAQLAVGVLVVGQIEEDRLYHDTIFGAELFGVGLAECHLDGSAVALGGFEGLLGGLDHPLGFAEHGGGVDRAGDAVEHPAVLCTKIRRHVAALFLAADNSEGGDFLERRHEILVQVLSDRRIGQCVHTKRFGVVSSKVGVLELPRDMQNEDKFLLLKSLLAGFGRRFDELDIGAEVAVANHLAWRSRLAFGFLAFGNGKA